MNSFSDDYFVNSTESHPCEKIAAKKSEFIWLQKLPEFEWNKFCLTLSNSGKDSQTFQIFVELSQNVGKV